jgi:general secretion pathway protein E
VDETGQQNVSTLKLGEILLKFTSLTEDQLRAGLEVQQEEGGLLGEVLVRKNFLHLNDIQKALCLQLELPYQDDLDFQKIDLELVKNLPNSYVKNNEVLPLYTVEDQATVAIVNPFNLELMNDLRIFLDKEIHPVIIPSAVLHEARNWVYEQIGAQQELEEIEQEGDAELELDGSIDILDATSEDTPQVIRFVNNMIFRAVKERASDIHIEPYEREMVIRYRIDGVLHDKHRQTKRAHAAISSRIKVMANLNIAEKRLPQDGRIKIKLAGKEIDIRLSTVPVQYGERLVMRILEKTTTIQDLESLGFHGPN